MKKIIWILIGVSALAALSVYALSVTTLGDVIINGGLNMTIGNVTMIDCLKFVSGGQICNLP